MPSKLDTLRTELEAAENRAERLKATTRELRRRRDDAREDALASTGADSPDDYIRSADTTAQLIALQTAAQRAHQDQVAAEADVDRLRAAVKEMGARHRRLTGDVQALEAQAPFWAEMYEAAAQALALVETIKQTARGASSSETLHDAEHARSFVASIENRTGQFRQALSEARRKLAEFEGAGG